MNLLGWLLIGALAALFSPAIHLLVVGPLVARWRRRRTDALYRGLYDSLINALSSGDEYVH